MSGIAPSPAVTTPPAGLARKTGWAVMLVLALSIALYAALVLLLPGFGPPFVAERRAVMPLVVIGHLAGGVIAMTIGPFQLNTRLREKAFGRHRWMGRTYAVAVLVGGSCALILSFWSQQGFVTHAGFGMLAVLWLTSTVMAWRRILAGDQAGHRRWMIRSYALTLAAVTLRIWLPLWLAAGLPFGPAYQAVAWVCWVPNLVIAEWLVLPRYRDAA